MKLPRASALCPLTTVPPSHLREGVRSGHAFSGPRSRADTVAAQTSPRQNLRGSRPVPRARMGPAPARPNRPPRNRRRPLAKGCTVLAAGWRWRLRAQAPFAVSVTAWGHPRLDEATLRDPRWLPASVGRRTQATPPPCRANGGGESSAWKTASDSKPTFAKVSFQLPVIARHALRSKPHSCTGRAPAPQWPDAAT